MPCGLKTRPARQPALYHPPPAAATPSRPSVVPACLSSSDSENRKNCPQHQHVVPAAVGDATQQPAHAGGSVGLWRLDRQPTLPSSAAATIFYPPSPTAA
jgi:hypothetical protein